MQSSPFTLLQDVAAGALPTAFAGVAPEIPDYVLENMKKAAVAAKEERGRLAQEHGGNHIGAAAEPLVPTATLSLEPAVPDGAGEAELTREALKAEHTTTAVDLTL